MLLLLPSGGGVKVAGTEESAPVLPEDAVGAGHDHAFVGHRADDLHHPAQLLLKLGRVDDETINTSLGKHT